MQQNRLGHIELSREGKMSNARKRFRAADVAAILRSFCHVTSTLNDEWRCEYTLDITETIAKNDVQHILQKLGAQDRARAATAAIQRGIIHL